MTNLITEARELCERATSGPWKVVDGKSFGVQSENKNIASCFKRENEIFIARSRTLIPELCDALENTEKQLQEQFDKTGAWLEEYNEMKIALENANAEIEQLREAQRWIPVTERLPTGCGYYLSVVERIAPDELGGNNTRVKIMRWLGADWRYPTHIPKWINEAITETVTHWMPLPKFEGGENDT